MGGGRNWGGGEVEERKNKKKTILELEKIWRKKMVAIKILNTF